LTLCRTEWRRFSDSICLVFQAKAAGLCPFVYV
jgi:hypothetical protein